MLEKAAPSKPLTRFFEHDHREMDALLRALRFGTAAKDLRRFAEFRRRLERHIGWEERELFPAFEARMPIPKAGPIAQMRAEHREILGLLAAITEALERADVFLARARAMALTETLVAHNWKEEGVLYPACDDLLSPQEAEKLLSRLERGS